ncbi:signal peptidase [Oceanicola sp. 22II-s10i]|uniref:imelysin family protein n=1 Tax=Oceanicola sp. 22II-s10i TaxID=1317116 RepID=UPI000B522ACE|nr:imelysin family protein [Oceanicola sp. 22II-s10i]OWU84602.1 signal peptidase [Oceanicola sp. 22II-s10i]
MRLAFALVLLATPVTAGVEEVVTDHIRPGLSAFVEQTTALELAADTDCRAPALRVPFHAAFDAWLRIGDLRLGPTEHAAISIAFWPDDRGFTQRTIGALVRDEAPAVSDPEAFSEVSVAGRGFFALEMLMYDPLYRDYRRDDYRCRLARAISADLAAQAKALRAAWSDFAGTLTSGGADGNATYLSPEEATRAVYTQILSSLEFTRDSRIGRPLGTFERPRPKRAEAWRSGRSLHDALVTVEAAVETATLLAGHDLPETQAALLRLRDVAGNVTDPSFQSVDDPGERLKVEIVQQRVKEVEAAIEAEVGAPMGIAPGFNSQDGD